MFVIACALLFSLLFAFLGFSASHLRSWERVWAATAASALVLIVWGAFLYIHFHPISQPVTEAPQKVQKTTDIELQAMRDIDSWIGVIDENSLRTAFDIPNVLEHNLSCISRNGQPYHGEPIQGTETVIGLMPNVGLFRAPNGAGLATVEQGAISLIFTRSGYESAKHQYARSAYLSDPLRAALTSMSSRVSDNMLLMIAVLNRAYKTDPSLITKYKEPPYIGAVANTYSDSFMPLRPMADNVSNAIRIRLGAE